MTPAETRALILDNVLTAFLAHAPDRVATLEWCLDGEVGGPETPGTWRRFSERPTVAFGHGYLLGMAEACNMTRLELLDAIGFSGDDTMADVARKLR